MLILTRRTGEVTDVTLPDGTRMQLVVLGVQGNQVRMGWIADVSIKIHRREITKRIARENAVAQGDIDGNRLEPEHLEQEAPPPEPAAPRQPIIRLKQSRVKNPDALEHRRLLEGLR